MPAPSVYTYAPTALVAAHTAFRDLLDTGAGNATVKIRSAADVLLSTIDLDDPCGTVNGTTGQLTLDAAGPDLSAAASGTAAYAEICDVAGTPQLALPVQTGTVAVSGVAVLNTTAIAAGGTVTLLSITIG